MTLLSSYLTKGYGDPICYYMPPPSSKKDLNDLISLAVERLEESGNDRRVQADTMKLCNNILCYFEKSPGDRAYFTENFFKIGIITSTTAWLENALTYSNPVPRCFVVESSLTVPLSFFEWLHQQHINNFAEFSPL